MKTSIRIIGQTPPPVGGVTIHTLRLFQWMRRENEFDLRLTSLNQNPNLRDEGIEIPRFPILWALKTLLFSFSENIVHYQGTRLAGLVFLSWVKFLHGSKFRLLWSRHGELVMPRIQQLGWPWKGVVLSALKRVDFVLSASDAVAAQVSAYGMRTAVAPAFLPPLPSLESPADYSFIEDFRGPNFLIVAGAFKISFDSQGKDIYGLDTLFEALNLQETNNLKTLILVPHLDTEGQSYLDSLFARLSPEKAQCIKIVSRSDIEGWEVIGRADLFVRATITDGDAISIREALFQDVRVLASDCTQRPPEVELFASGNPRDLADKIALLSQQSRSPREPSAAQETFLEKFLRIYRSEAALLERQD